MLLSKIQNDIESITNLKAKFDQFWRVIFSLTPFLSSPQLHLCLQRIDRVLVETGRNGRPEFLSSCPWLHSPWSRRVSPPSVRSTTTITTSCIHIKSVPQSPSLRVASQSKQPEKSYGSGCWRTEPRGRCGG